MVNCYDDIILTLQKKVNKISKKKWEKDECPPEFIVSNLFVYGEDGKKVIEHKIILTVVHRGMGQSIVLYPKLDSNYGYEPLEQEMEHLYNRTM